MREEARIARFLKDRLASGQGSALATVIGVQGSAYRREGARLAIDGEGRFTGMISGGCLEADVAEAALQVISSGKPVLRHFDLRDDSPFGLGLGCDGEVDVLIEPVSDSSIWQVWLEALKDGQRAVRAVALIESADGPPGSTLICIGESEFEGQLGHPALNEAAARRSLELYRSPTAEPRVETISDTALFFDVNLAPPVLTIFGAGDDVKPLSSLAQQAGFRVDIVDPRPAYLCEKRFPGAFLTLARPEELQNSVELRPDAFVLIMNHHLERDRAALRFALESEVNYIGVLGPRSRFDKLAADLKKQLPNELPGSRIFNPVGLDIGARGPEEVAISIVGELLAIHNDLEGGFLRDRKGAIHAVSEENSGVDSYAGKRETSDKGPA